MLPFCGYNMADYWAHWLTFADRMDAEQLPKIFFVNWFRKGPDGKFLWPGFGENSRVLAWIFERCAGRGAATTTPIGRLPAKGAIDTRGLDITDAEWAELFRVDADEWRDEILAIRAHYATFADRLPPLLIEQLNDLAARLRLQR
jgi:phosphoenolpyruvate carboxykinase (GTP)